MSQLATELFDIFMKKGSLQMNRHHEGSTIQIQGGSFTDVRGNLNVHNGDVLNAHNLNVSVDRSETGE